jgi:hypothetical protein
VSSIPTHLLNLDKEFVAACLAISNQIGNPSPISPTDTHDSPTAFSFRKFSRDVVDSKATRLTDKYPNAYSDFYGSGTPCVFKSGPEWHVRKGPQAQGIERGSVYRHAIGRTWLSIGVKWTSINPLAYADAGEAKPFCSLILSIGVKPHSLLYDAAVAAAAVVKDILAEAGFSAIEVALSSQ